TFFDAVRGDEAGGLTHAAYDSGYRRFWYGRDLTPGEVGCYLSHLELWRMVAEGEEPAILIMEDDVVLQPYFQLALSAASTCTTPWEMLRLYGIFTRKTLVVEKLGGEYMLVRYREGPRGTQAY